MKTAVRSGCGRRGFALLLPLALLPLACDSSGGSSSESITLYTCVNDESIQPVISQFEAEYSGSEVELFRAPTGDLNARVAGDVRSGGLKADVVWACDPLTMQGYVDQELVGEWTPDNASDIPDQFRTEDYVGAAVLYMVAVYHDGVPPPSSWSDLTEPDYDPVAVADPNVAASALGALGWFSQAPDYGLDFYATLKEHGAEQLGTPDEVTTGVAQGLYQAGITIANSAYLAKDSGSPIGVVWPEPGAVAIYGPIALAKDSVDSTLAKDFVSYVVSEPGQQVLAKAGSYPTLPGVEGPELPADALVVYPDWSKITADRDALLSDYQKIFGG
ncbi:MAG: extracellular solute-binding protein [Nocardioidaceae bacterium]